MNTLPPNTQIRVIRGLKEHSGNSLDEEDLELKVWVDCGEGGEEG